VEDLEEQFENEGDNLENVKELEEQFENEGDQLENEENGFENEGDELENVEDPFGNEEDTFENEGDQFENEGDQQDSEIDRMIEEEFDKEAAEPENVNSQEEEFEEDGQEFDEDTEFDKEEAEFTGEDTEQEIEDAEGEDTEETKIDENEPGKGKEGIAEQDTEFVREEEEFEREERVFENDEVDKEKEDVEFDEGDEEVEFEGEEPEHETSVRQRRNRTEKTNTTGAVEKTFAEQFVTAYPAVSLTQTKRFLSEQESIYEQRKRRIAHFCKQREAPQNIGKFNTTLIHLAKKDISYCPIPKVSSSTWCKNFHKLAPDMAAVADDLWSCYNLPRMDVKSEHLQSSWTESLSLGIVRHPFSRLVSVYHQKFVGRNVNFRNGHDYWDKLNKFVIKKFRSANQTVESKYKSTAKPQEMLEYVLTTLEPWSLTGPDIHWKPQSESCPWCILDFDIYAHLEEIQQDTVYFMLKTGTKLADDLHLNSLGSRTKEKEFWESVQPDMIKKLLAPEAYGLDLKMFGYTVTKYLDSIGYGGFNEKTR